MAGPGELDSARLRRDLSLALRRRLTVYTAFGAAGLTVVFSIVAATTAPGKTGPAATPPPQSDPFSGRQSLEPDDNQPSLVVPEQPPQSGFGGSPVAISGGS
ncbi:MAG TPA: hypothetical protein VND54_03480 [Candidatus Saccharimonadales bacterium]|nr:hypothetical protein [Candidatus Saccharimonadales bacterium]